MLHRLILKVTKFHLPPPKRLSTVIKNIFGGHHAPPPQCQMGFNCLLEGCHSNRKKALLRYNKFKRVNYLTELYLPIARVLIKVSLRMFEVKINFKTKYNCKLNSPFYIDETEAIDHIFLILRWGPLPSAYEVSDLRETRLRGR